MSNNNGDAVGFITIVITGALALFAYKFSRDIGADFQSTLWSVVQSIVVLGLAGIVLWKLSPPLLPFSAAVLSLLWPCWWKVLDSIASGGSNPQEPSPFNFMPPDIWWNGPWFKYGTEALLIGLAVYLFIRHREDSY
jgi:hypothetical protein